MEIKGAYDYVRGLLNQYFLKGVDSPEELNGSALSGLNDTHDTETFPTPAEVLTSTETQDPSIVRPNYWAHSMGP